MKLDNLNFIVVEGPIGVGKTSLSRKLAKTFNTDLVLEGADENPFLPKFYKDPRGSAFQAQLFFLLQRAHQLQNMRQGELFNQVRIADYLIEKDRLFAQITLDENEMRMYDQIYQHLTIDSPKPDLVIYLQAPVSVLRSRIARRGIDYEQVIGQDYLQQIADAYTELFHYYSASPLLIVNAEDFDPVGKEGDYDALLACIKEIEYGRHYYNPVSLAV